MAHLKAENADSNIRAYKVFRLVVSGKVDPYSSKIAEHLDKSQGDISHVLSKLTERNFLQKGEKTRAQHYEVNWEGLHSFFVERWEEMDVEASPVSQEFLEKYVEFYVNETKNSTIEDMLIDDLQLALEIYDELEELPDDLEDILYEMLDSRRSVSPHRFVEYALQGDEK